MRSVKVERPHLSARPSYFGHPTGARVAPQRCPILRKDKQKLYKKYILQGFFNIIDILGKEKTGILIVVDHACINKLKEEKPKNYDAAELVGWELQSP